MRYIIGLGSNDGDRELHLQHALSFLSEIAESVYPSTHYASPAMGGGKAHYLNSVAIVDFSGPEDQLEAMLKACEVMEGRTQKARSEGRVPLDMDIVVAGEEVRRPADMSRYFFRRGYEELLSALGEI